MQAYRLAKAPTVCIYTGLDMGRKVKKGDTCPHMAVLFLLKVKFSANQAILPTNCTPIYGLFVQFSFVFSTYEHLYSYDSLIVGAVVCEWSRGDLIRLYYCRYGNTLLGQVT